MAGIRHSLFSPAVFLIIVFIATGFLMWLVDRRVQSKRRKEKPLKRFSKNKEGEGA